MCHFVSVHFSFIHTYLYLLCALLYNLYCIVVSEFLYPSHLRPNDKKILYIYRLKILISRIFYQRRWCIYLAEKFFTLKYFNVVNRLFWSAWKGLQNVWNAVEWAHARSKWRVYDSRYWHWPFSTGTRIVLLCSQRNSVSRIGTVSSARCSWDTLPASAKNIVDIREEDGSGSGLDRLRMSRLIYRRLFGYKGIVDDRVINVQIRKIISFFSLSNFHWMTFLQR